MFCQIFVFYLYYCFLHFSGNYYTKKAAKDTKKEAKKETKKETKKDSKKGQKDIKI